MSDAAFEVATRGAVSAAAIAWCWLGEARLTVVAKLTFSFGADGVVLEPSRAIGADARRLPLPELVPRLPRCDVLVVTPASATMRLELSRGDEVLLDRPVLSPAPARPTRLVLPLELPDEHRFDAAHAAPIHQRVEHLAGGERVRLTGADREVELTVPSLRPEVTVHGAEEPVACVLDTLAIDVPEGRLTLLFRAEVPAAGAQRAEVVVQGEAAFAGFDTTVAIEAQADELVRTAAILPGDGGGPALPFASPFVAPRAQPDLMRTALVLDAPPVAAPLPFAGAVPPPPTSESESWRSGATMSSDADELGVDSLPFREAEEEAHSLPPAEAAPPAIDEDDGRALREAREQAAIEAARRADEEAARFAAEQQAAELREGIRQAKDEQAKRVRAQTLRDNLYGFKRKA
jgi:hypothetical protein